MRDGLRAVDDDDRALLVPPGDEPLDGIDGAERVRDVSAAEHLDVAARRDRVELVELQLSVLVDWDHRELGSGPSGDVLPGDEVRVVLHLGHDHEVARPEVVEPPAVGDER